MASFSKLIEQNMIEKFSYLPQLNSNMTVGNLLNGYLINSYSKSDMFNIICGISPSNNIFSEHELSVICDSVKNDVKQNYAWWVSADYINSTLLKRLKQKGIVQEENDALMHLNLDEFTESSINKRLNIRAVKNKDTLKDFIKVLGTTMPNDYEDIMQFYNQCCTDIFNPQTKQALFVGYLNTVAVATSSIFTDNNNLPGIYDIVTHPIYRRKGIGLEMTINTIVWIKEKGYKACVLSASTEGKGIYSKVGFTENGNIYTFVPEIKY